MGGSGGSFGYPDINRDDVLKKIKESESETEKQDYESWVSSFLEDLLGQINNRDTEAIQKHLNTILSALNDEIDGNVTTKFGGSISKHTHIDGISDIDALVILNNSELANKSPKEVLEYFFQRLRDRFPNTPIEKGDTAVTLSFADGDVQLVPAIKFKTAIKIPDGKEWSTSIKPESFAKGLTNLNSNFNGKLIPAIKLIKAIVSGFPDRHQLKGYHIESLALQIFAKRVSENSGITKVKSLVTEFFKEAPKFVRKQIKDITGQTKYVDEYLGKNDSIQRIMAADTLERTFRQIELSDTGTIKSTWTDLFSNL
jgi:hypothetical protein